MSMHGNTEEYEVTRSIKWWIVAPLSLLLLWRAFSWENIDYSSLLYLLGLWVNIGLFMSGMEYWKAVASTACAWLFIGYVLMPMANQQMYLDGLKLHHQVSHRHGGE
jgi:hypothetical protein